MNVADFDFDLPVSRIALRPVSPRDAARLLRVSADGALSDHKVADLPRLLRPGDVMVFNDTRVISARLVGARERDGVAARIEATLIERQTPSRWAALVKPAKRLRPGDRIVFGGTDDRGGPALALAAAVTDRGEGGETSLQFDLGGDALDAAIAKYGAMPLPPYIAGRRSPDERDKDDYQTVYARPAGSVAAPTAGLHFTPELLERLGGAGVERRFVTLHVGAGTFLPVKAATLEAHVMHAEWGRVSVDTAETLNRARAAGGRIVAVGTTSLRLLESALGPEGDFQAFSGETRLFITPGRPVRAADALMTNFHLPRSTLFILVCAFSGEAAMRRAYAHAVARGYRFYSYGDASLLWRAA